MAAYRRVYDSGHLQADSQEPGSAPEPYARQSSSVLTTFNFTFYDASHTRKPRVDAAYCHTRRNVAWSVCCANTAGQFVGRLAPAQEAILID